eukprot:6259650-Amphidinium_carterae.1
MGRQNLFLALVVRRPNPVKQGISELEDAQTLQKQGMFELEGAQNPTKQGIFDLFLGGWRACGAFVRVFTRPVVPLRPCRSFSAAPRSRMEVHGCQAWIGTPCYQLWNL